MIYVIAGVAGCGKTTISKELGRRLGILGYDADDFHPDSNIRKMRNGTPLTDNDRLPWLKHLASEMSKWGQNNDTILACSALKKSYRDLLLTYSGEDLRFIYLKISKNVAAKRLSSRDGHFFPEELIESQFEVLEITDELIVVNAEQPIAEVCEEIERKIKYNKVEN